MNEPPPLPPLPKKPSEFITPPPTRAYVKVAVPLDAKTYREINSALSELSLQLGIEMSVAKFIMRTVTEHWVTQLERYRKLEPMLRSRPK